MPRCEESAVAKCNNSYWNRLALLIGECEILI